MTNRIYSGDRQKLPAYLTKLYLLGFKAAVNIDTVAYPAFWWELHAQNPDAAEALNLDVRNALLDRVTL